MQKLIFSISLFMGMIVLHGCTKTNEMPPANTGLIRDYVLPAAGFLTQEERDVLNARRAEYNSIL